ncbi:MAG: hypothetical protein IJU26_07510 [Synergistaceae bacterium]|nr:hypothetical protein [Synergistaceae bacterium]
MNVSLSRVSGQDSDNWQTVVEIFQKPEQFSSSHDISRIIEKLNENMSKSLLCFLDDSQRGKQRRQVLWVLVVVLFGNGWDNSENRQKVLNVMRQWEIDEAIYHEMKDTVETYRVITTEDNKQDLDQSIQDLIELG